MEGGAVAGSRATITAVVLAAGTSSRLGRPKQLLDLDGRPVLQHVVDLAAACFDEIVLVLGHEAGTVERALSLPAGARVVVNPDYLRGQSTSLRAGLAEVSEAADAAAILLGDQPGLDPSVVARVVESFRLTDKSAARPRFRDGPGHPVVLARRAFDLAVSAKGDEGLRAVLGSGDVEEVEIDGDAPIDIDTPEAYRRLLRS